MLMNVRAIPARMEELVAMKSTHTTAHVWLDIQVQTVKVVCRFLVINLGASSVLSVCHAFHEEGNYNLDWVLRQINYRNTLFSYPS